MANNAIATVAPDEWSMIQQQSQALVSSGFLPRAVDTWQKAAAIILLGRELGIPPWAAINGINVIQQKPTVSPQLMLGMINAKGQLDDMTISDDGSACTVTMKRKGRTPHSYTFSMTDAKAMGLDSKENWRKQPAIMRQWRAVAGCARVVFADVILGLYTPEEMGAEVVADNEGNMTIVTPPQSAPPILIRRETPAERTETSQGATQAPPAQNAPTPASGAQTGTAETQRPNLNSIPPIESGQQNGGGFDELFPPDIPGAKVITLDNGTQVHRTVKLSTEPVPGRDTSGFPIIGGGKIQWIDLLNKALAEKLVKEKTHFSNQIDLCIREGLITDLETVSTEGVLDAMRKHVAAKDMQREGTGR